jgi:hypothetical protein
MKKIIKKSITLASLATLAPILSSSTYAEIYKWTDENGTIHYTATPPMQKQKRIKATNIEDEIRSAAGKYRPSANGTTKTGAETNTAASAKSPENKKDEELAGPDAKLIEYCDNQRNNVEQLKKNFRNVWIDVKGQKTALDQEQRKEKVEYLNKRIQEDCKGVSPKKP